MDRVIISDDNVRIVLTVYVDDTEKGSSAAAVVELNPMDALGLASNLFDAGFRHLGREQAYHEGNERHSLPLSGVVEEPCQ